jgi:hypothetical protein
MSAVREAWTDERLDDLAKHMDGGFRDVRDEIRDVREEVRAFRGEMNAEFASSRAETNARFDAVNARFDAMQRTILQVGGGLAGAILVGFMGLIATQL